jgi:hypothetical protein
MSITPPGLVSGPSLIQQPPLVPAVSAPQPVSAASNAKNDGGSSGDAGRSGSSGSGAVYVPQRRDEMPPLYDKPAALDASASAPAPAPKSSAHLHPFSNGDTAYQDSATLAAPPASGAKASKNLAEVAASAAYSMIADAGTMPISVLAPLRGA